MSELNAVEQAKQDQAAARKLMNEASRRRYAVDDEYREKERQRARVSKRKNRTSKYRKEYYEKNKEKILKAAKVRNAKKKATATPDVEKNTAAKKADYDKAYYLKNRAKILEQKKRYDKNRKKKETVVESTNKIINDTLQLIKLAKDNLNREGGIPVANVLLEAVIQLMEAENKD